MIYLLSHYKNYIFQMSTMLADVFEHALTLVIDDIKVVKDMVLWKIFR